MILPYVYKLTNDKTEEYYFGYRSKNVSLGKKPTEDIGVSYLTSSKYVKPRFSDFQVIILAEFFSAHDAYEFEQSLIRLYISDPLCLNKHYQIKSDKKFRHDVKHSPEAKKKMSGPRGKINRTAPGHIPWNKGLNKNTNNTLALMAEKRKTIGNKHQIGIKHSPERIEKVRQKLKDRKVTSEQRQKMSKARKGRTWIDIYGEEETKRRKENSLKGSAHPAAVTIITPLGTFHTMNEATKQLKLSDFTIRRRCKSSDLKWKDWYYADSKNKIS